MTEKENLNVDSKEIPEIEDVRVAPYTQQVVPEDAPVEEAYAQPRVENAYPRAYPQPFEDPTERKAKK
ncbi:hypothetical protein BSR29_03155 [Boudabousia liubingyangii]|uniref:Uncharacterized protein n=1 Tax=Boudabousia liubingyangii TaxID=1921764 RepID=A0A1Q5PMW1_9ACTO|nr:hypothetical protein [Boudabousia liubingyangii]OKL47445.1 hypothetical protein BSR28_02730 [Boudabousia liubingyangii]OKL48867.1 hypothetical protein BSR29_03155 [Boudabousia liubingyangii]